MHSKNTLRLHKLLQNLLSEWHSLPSKHGNHGKCLAEIIAIVRERAKGSEVMDRTTTTTTTTTSEN